MKLTKFIIKSLIVGIILSGCAGTKFAEKAMKKNAINLPYDAVIVPGVPYEDSRMSDIFKARILWAVMLYDSGYTKNIIFSGSAVGTPYLEGKVMKIIADSMGVSPLHTFAETKAEHSTENAYYGLKMAKALGFTKVALATDPFQTKMLKKFLKKRCENMLYLPVIFRKIDPTGKRILTIPAVNPQDAYVPNFVPLAERESFWERFRGTRGKHIDFSK